MSGTGKSTETERRLAVAQGPGWKWGLTVSKLKELWVGGMTGMF